MINKIDFRPYGISLLLHLALLLPLLFLPGTTPGRLTEPVEFEVIENPKLSEKASLRAIELRQPRPERPEPPRPEPEKDSRQVFGISKNTLTDDTSTGSAIEVKKGNTLAKKEDDLELQEGDEEALPIPVEEFLVTSMPDLKSEIRIPYPEEARKNGIEGPVVMDLLIDEEGKVREVELVEGPGGGLNEAAVSAVRNLEFSPARVEQRTVAVKIRYIYRFVLEN